MAGTAAKKGGKNRKFGTNAEYCKLYTAAGLHDKNRKRRMRRHLLAHPEDAQAIKAFEVVYGFASNLRVIERGASTDRECYRRALRHRARNRDIALQGRLREARSIRRHARRIAAEKAANQDKHQNKTVVTEVA